jgi:hypothetical protein
MPVTAWKTAPPLLPFINEPPRGKLLKVPVPRLSTAPARQRLKPRREKNKRGRLNILVYHSDK